MTKLQIEMNNFLFFHLNLAIDNLGPWWSSINLSTAACTRTCASVIIIGMTQTITRSYDIVLYQPSTECHFDIVSKMPSENI